MEDEHGEAVEPVAAEVHTPELPERLPRSPVTLSVQQGTVAIASDEVVRGIENLETRVSVPVLETRQLCQKIVGDVQSLQVRQLEEL